MIHNTWSKTIMGLPGTLNLLDNKDKLKVIVLVEPRRLSSLLVIHCSIYNSENDLFVIKDNKTIIK